MTDKPHVPEWVRRMRLGQFPRVSGGAPLTPKSKPEQPKSAERKRAA